MSLQIRRMQLDDVDNVYAIEVVAHRSPWTRDILRDCMLVNYDCRVLEIDSASGPSLVGYSISRFDQNSCHILNLCITPRMQGNGYGQLLLQNIINSEQSSAVDTMVLEVRPSNLAALHLYQKVGFVQTATKEGYYQDDGMLEDAVVLKKKLRE